MSRLRLSSLLILAALTPPTAFAQTPRPEDGSAFLCSDGTKMVLAFTDTDAEAGSGITALVWLHGETFRLPYLPPEPGPVQVAWSDGEHALTWSPGVRLMWMGDREHLMCGRGEHEHQKR